MKTLYWVTFWLMILLVFSFLISFVHLGFFNLWVAFGISVIKSILVILYFMEIKSATPLIKAASLSGFVLLFILITLTYTDYLTRHEFKVEEVLHLKEETNHP